MAGNIARLQQDVSDLKTRETRRCSRCECSGHRSIQRLASPSVFTYQSGVLVDPATTKEEFQDQTSRKPSFVASAVALKKRLSHRSSDNKTPRAILRKNRSKPQDDSSDQSTAVTRVVPTPRTEVTVMSKPDEVSTPSQADRYPTSLSGRSKAARNPTLSDILWKRSNTSGDLLKHTDEERQAARLRHQIRTRRSLPSESGAEQVPGDGDDEAENDVPDDADYHEHAPRTASWLPRSAFISDF
ncbi:hypothetical protein PR003_g14392 [Phytophthora rubi]|uniref:Uncharacterized protein n=1 Tax=Phytophthora rubi TaxID=129364 RepID=A0A6A3GI13_9STRA|nr:hypothetical protein PR001_g31707 [Phytophthora rubi]KAE8959324.1 hypothetical protein PR002_g30578 [Phytophthora rubi]KAE9332688.1 hypothetical protein PR003_g14392 [Phytophthora rubi]